MPHHYTLASIARELLVAGHPHRALVVCHAVERLEHLERDRMKFANIIEKLNKQIIELQQQVANSVPVDQKDRDALAGYDDEGNPVEDHTTTAEELTAELKTSADALNGAIAENQ